MAINLCCQCSITACTKHWTRLGIWVETGEIRSLQGIDTSRVEQVVKAGEIETATHRTCFILRLTCREKAEFKPTIYIKQFFSILKVIKRNQSVLVNQF